MKKLVNEFLTMSFTASLVLVVVGAILLILPGLTLAVMCNALAVILIINGISMAYNSYKVKGGINLFDGFTWGILSIVFGIFVAVNNGLFISILPTILGLWIITSSCFKLRVCIAMDKEFSTSLIMSLITLGCGLFLLFNPITSAELLARMVGLSVLIYATLDVVETLTFKRKINKIEKIFKD